MQLRRADELHAQLKAATPEDSRNVNAEAVAVASRQTTRVRALAREIAGRDAELLDLLAQ